MNEPLTIHVYALSISDALGYRGQKAVADATVKGREYRIIGGHMVRLLLHVYPTAAAILRSTTDADTAIGDLEVAAPLTQNFLDQNFTKQGGNLFYRDVAPGHRIEINVLSSSDRTNPRYQTKECSMRRPDRHTPRAGLRIQPRTPHSERESRTK